MNYYERHLGDYARDTGHLSLLEHGVYTLLLDRYYASEQGIPSSQAYRFARARTEDERAAVDAVLAEFFKLDGELWIHERVEAEIAKASLRIEAAKVNGRKGGRPRKEPIGNGNETQEKPSGFPVGNPDLTQIKAHHTPNTKPQSPEELGKTEVHTNGTTGDEPADGVCDPPSNVVQASILLRKRGCLVTPQNPDLIEAIREGVTPAELDALAEIYPGKPAGYVITAARRQRAEGASKLTETNHAIGTSGRKLSAAEQVQQAILERRGREAAGDTAPLVAIGY